MNATDFAKFFTKLCGKTEPLTWQTKLATSKDCGNRLIRIPTGFGKTLGVFAAWTWHRVRQRNDDWPRRLIWCLPMRVLVEQTEKEARAVLERLGVLWDKKSAHDGKIGVHLLMGGVDAGQWHLYPECDAVLIGNRPLRIL
jgi:CRISPR-associated endonuclease/helicase Cas3